MKLFLLLCLLSALASDALAQTREELRQMYLHGEYATIEQFARAGDVRAEAWMGLIKQQAGRRAEAKDWWRRAAEKGNGWALMSLADMHRRDQENEQAAYWYRRGAEQGYPSAQVQLAKFLLDGIGVPKDEKDALRWFSAAAAQHLPSAYYLLATLYATGRGAPRNPIEAYALATIAACVWKDDSLDVSAEARALNVRLTAELTADQMHRALQRAKEIRSDFAEHGCEP